MNYFLIALLSCSIGSFVGLGGDIIIIPLLLSLGIPKALISINTDLTMLFMTFMSTFIYRKRHQGDFKTAVLIAIGIIPGASLGVYINSFITVHIFNLFFIILLFILIFIMFFEKRLPKIILPNWTKPFVGLSIGIISGLFGLGGAIMLIPILLIFYGFDQKGASATTLSLIFISTFITVSNYYFRGYHNLTYCIFMIPGALLGSKIGTFFNKKASNELISLSFKLILIGIFIKQLIMLFYI
ncbi:sulfite exporter TauE/SafE family protein [uncultured Clostridium sp.]|uniref:sulfite exporter TauE/SafE family protein n=1 Tax=uncultured Clostridium sp. TaxID=59620 RepID=UPI002585CFBA|nr:sulfite exporter TauE/SafE family protein [uncultured Clostridium sp.]